MDRSNLRLAAKLLAKAQDSNFDAEAAALAERAYMLLAELLNNFDAETEQPGTRRRERRHLQDRRASQRRRGWWKPRAGSDPEAAYRRREAGMATPVDGDIDLRA